MLTMSLLYGYDDASVWKLVRELLEKLTRRCKDHHPVIEESGERDVSPIVIYQRSRLTKVRAAVPGTEQWVMT